MMWGGYEQMQAEVMVAEGARATALQANGGLDIEPSRNGFSVVR